MLSCAVCSSELNGHYEFRPDSSPICISCHEADERELRSAMKTGRIPKLAPGNAIDALVAAPAEVLPPESTGSIVCGPASGTQDIVIADTPRPQRSYTRVAVIAAGALATSALAIFALL